MYSNRHLGDRNLTIALDKYLSAQDLVEQIGTPVFRTELITLGLKCGGSVPIETKNIVIMSLTPQKLLTRRQLETNEHVDNFKSVRGKGHAQLLGRFQFSYIGL